MPRSSTSSFSHVQLDTGDEPEPWPVRRPDSDTPFRIALLGDFSGRACRGAFDPTLSGRRFIQVDRDNFDDVLARFNVQLESISIRELDDFHPDRLYDRLDIFRSLRDTRERLEDRSTFQSAAAEVQSWAARAAAAPEPAPLDPEVGRLSTEQLFDRMLEEVAPGGPAIERPRRKPDEFQELLRNIVAPHLEAKTDPRQPEMIAQVDKVISGQMRAILHHPDFQALEAAWRGLFFLVRRLETDTGLKLYLFDVTKRELAASGDRLYELIVEQSVGTPGADPWALLAGIYTFDNTPLDLEPLRQVGKLARAASAPFLAGASPRILGCPSLAGMPDPRSWQPDPDADRLWQALRRTPEAGWIGLALPRFLLRLPYGRATDSTERFDFEEFAGQPAHEDYLWGNPALALLTLLGAGFSDEGWDMQPGRHRDVEGLPAHLYQQNGESILKPVAEALLTEHAANAILDKGIMPLLTMKDSDRARLARFQSIADPPSGLGGRWS